MKQQVYRAFSDGISKTLVEHAEKTGERVPADVMIELTRLCSIKCTHCYIGDARWIKDPNEMSTQQVKDLLDMLAAKGTLWVCFTGGEAMLRRDFKEIWLHAKQKGFLLTLFSNATLIDEAMMDFLVEYPPFNFEISIYGATEATYEAVSLVKGSYKRFMRGISNLRRHPELKWTMKSVVIQQNAHELDAMKELAREWGVDFKYDGNINPSVGFGKSGGKAPCATRVTEEEFVRAELGDQERVDEMIKFTSHAQSCGDNESDIRGDNLYSCSAGKNDFYLTANGKMQMCLLTGHRGHELFRKNMSVEKAFDKAWQSFGLARQEKIRKDSPCYECDLASICNNCPGFSFLENGNEHGAVEYLCRMTHMKAELLKLPHKCKDNHFHHRLKGQEHEKEKGLCQAGSEKNSPGCGSAACVGVQNGELKG